MCGNENLHGVVFATTMWDKFAPELVSEAFDRHQDLRRRIYEEMGDNGAQIVPLTAGAADAVDVVEHILRRKSRITLDFQRQLVDEDRPLHETEVGKVLFTIPSDVLYQRRDAIDKAQQAIVADVKEQDKASTAKRGIAMRSILTELESVTESDAQMQLKLSKVRDDWEKKLQAEREALERAARTTEELFTIKTKALENLHRQNRSFVPRKPAMATEMALVDDLEQLGRQEELIMWRKSQRLETRHAHRGEGSGTLAAIGATLAVGQLIATMACAVM